LARGRRRLIARRQRHAGNRHHRPKQYPHTVRIRERLANQTMLSCDTPESITPRNPAALPSTATNSTC
jgi:hypothetical protein